MYLYTLRHLTCTHTLKNPGLYGATPTLEDLSSVMEKTVTWTLWVPSKLNLSFTGDLQISQTHFLENLQTPFLESQHPKLQL